MPLQARIWFALNRARVAAVARNHSLGVPRHLHPRGFDYGGWTQIEAAGYINDAGLRSRKLISSKSESSAASGETQVKFR
jgi:hypothetical protein